MIKYSVVEIKENKIEVPCGNLFSKFKQAYDFLDTLEVRNSLYFGNDKEYRIIKIPFEEIDEDYEHPHYNRIEVIGVILEPICDSFKEVKKCTFMITN